MNSIDKVLDHSGGDGTCIEDFRDHKLAKVVERVRHHLVFQMYMENFLHLNSVREFDSNADIGLFALKMVNIQIGTNVLANSQGKFDQSLIYPPFLG